MIKGIIFDCFGVLMADGLRAEVDAVESVDPERGQALHDIFKQIDRGMLTLDESLQQLGEIMHVEPQELFRRINASLVKNTQLIAFIRTLRPTYKVAMLSNVRGRERLDELFGPGELDSLFDVVVASGDIGIIKPEREIYELTAEKLGVAPEDCVMIDDKSDYCEGAEAVGMRSILFGNTAKGIADLKALIDTENQTH